MIVPATSIWFEDSIGPGSKNNLHHIWCSIEDTNLQVARIVSTLLVYPKFHNHASK